MGNLPSQSVKRLSQGHAYHGRAVLSPPLELDLGVPAQEGAFDHVVRSIHCIQLQSPFSAGRSCGLNHPLLFFYHSGDPVDEGRQQHQQNNLANQFSCA
jgi:hypothetical protein